MAPIRIATIAVALVVIAVFAIIGGALTMRAGLYDVAADVPHNPAVYRLLQYARDRSIAVHAAGIEPPANLESKQRIQAGAAEYAEMCSRCHLAPGMKPTEISRGLYPGAPELSRGVPLTAAEKFWVLKHGIKMSGMPAWGRSHDDDLLWDIVAFLQRLPQISANEYETLVQNAPDAHEEMMHDMTIGEGAAENNEPDD